MITQERLRVFLDSLTEDNPPYLAKLEEECLAERIPIVRRQTQQLLKFFLADKKPSRILEVGTAAGFSALFMSEYAPGECRITTIENQKERIVRARENFARLDTGKRISLLEGDAAALLPQLEGPYEFIFMDAAKGQYLRFLPQVLRLLAPKGLLLSDNVLQEGDILESRYAVTRRNRTIHARMRDYLYQLTHHDLLTTVILPVGDGVAISVRR